MSWHMAIEKCGTAVAAVHADCGARGKGMTLHMAVLVMHVECVHGGPVLRERAQHNHLLVR